MLSEVIDSALDLPDALFISLLAHTLSEGFPEIKLITYALTDNSYYAIKPNFCDRCSKIKSQGTCRIYALTD